MTQGTAILRTENLKMHFPIYRGLVFRKETAVVKAVDGVDLELYPGETLGLVGESGCGKSTLGRTILRLYQPTDGRIFLGGKDVSHLSGDALRAIRTEFQMIFQDPYASLNPRMTVYDIIAEPLLTHKLTQTREQLDKRVRDLMELVGLSPRFIRKYPHEFSGGQRQRIAVARALSINPKIVICDEPVSALDVSIQAQILNLLADLQKELGLSYVFIAHDIAAVRHISDRVAVMYLGKIVECAPTRELFANPRHPYTRALLSAVPTPDPDKERRRQHVLLEGDLPSPMKPPSGCHFHTRCPVAIDACSRQVPVLEQLSSEQSAPHQASCIRLHDETFAPPC